jgi:hypothetical protein
MEPSDPADSPWGHQEPPCAIHGMGPCLYPVVQRQPIFTSPCEGEGEGVTEEEEDDVVVITVVDKDDKPIEVIPVPESTPPKPPYKQTIRIRILASSMV